MALPVLDAVFASSADLPRRQMLARWLVEELGEVQAPSNVLVSGSGSIGVDGFYIDSGVFDGKRFYNLESGGYVVAWDNPNWVIRSVTSITIYTSNNNVEFPWQVTTWSVASGSAPVPTVSESPAVSPIAKYYDLPERYLWAKIAVVAGGPKDEAAYIGLPKQYAWKDIYDAVLGSSLGTIDWVEKQAIGHIAAAYRGDTANPESLATYIDWPWRYQVASIIDVLTPTYFLVSGGGIWKLTVDVDGIVTTEPAGSGIGVASVLVKSPDSSVFSLTVDDSGILTVAPSGSSTNRQWISYRSGNNIFLIKVDNSGILTTEKQ